MQHPVSMFTVCRFVVDRCKVLWTGSEVTIAQDPLNRQICIAFWIQFAVAIPYYCNSEMETFIVVVMTVLLCITVKMTNAQGEVTSY